MEDNNSLFKKLIAKKTGYSESTYETRTELKKCQSFLRQYHPLEINPRHVGREIEELCYKLEIHSLDFKAVAIRNFYRKLLEFCDNSIDSDYYLLMNGIVLFLLEIGESIVNSYEYEEIIEQNEVLIKENINWKEILTQSEDIISLTRQDYSIDDLSEYSSDSENEADLPSYKTNREETNDYDTSIAINPVITHDNWNLEDLKHVCKSNLQIEYWFDSYETKFVSKSLKQNSQRNFSVFIDDWEKYIKLVSFDYFRDEYKNRVEITDYQLIREIIDLLMGSIESSLVKTEYDLVIITKNRYILSKSVKLINITWKSVDNILQEFVEIATYCLQLRTVSAYIIRDHFSTPLPPSIVAFGEQIHFYVNEFNNFLLKLETESRGNLGVSIIELMSLIDNWMPRMRYLSELVVNICSNRFETLHFNSTIIRLLNVLHKTMNETCLVLIDKWITKRTIDLFYHSFKPYLFALDALLSGQVHISSRNLFLITKKDSSTSSANSSSSFNRAQIIDYWNNNFSFNQQSEDSNSNNINNSKIVLLNNNVPVLLQPFLVELISTIKSIDLLHVLSTELTRPGIVNSVIIEPGSFIENFNRKRKSRGKNLREISLYNYQPKIDFILPEQQILLKYISDNLIKHLSINHKEEILQFDNENDEDDDDDDDDDNDLTESCKNLHFNLFLKIIDRYRSVNSHLISTVITDLGLESSLIALKSIYFFQAGVEMYDFCSYIFDEMINSSFSAFSSSSFCLNLNLKFQQILSESTIPNLRQEAVRFTISLPSTETEPTNSDWTTTNFCLPEIVIDYQVEWNLKLLISDHIIDICNKCFRFLLNLKFAKYCLESKIHLERNLNNRHHRWSVLENRRMCSLRLKLLQIINNFHAYIMNTFILPSWDLLNINISNNRDKKFVVDFTDFIFQISQPFQTMLRGCLQSQEMITVEKAIKNVISLGIEIAQVDVGSNRILVKRLEQRYSKLIDFISAMFRSLSYLGISISELDMSAFK